MVRTANRKRQSLKQNEANNNGQTNSQSTDKSSEAASESLKEVIDNVNAANDSTGEHSDAESSVYSGLSEDEGSTSSSDESDSDESSDEQGDRFDSNNASFQTDDEIAATPKEDEYAYDSSDEEDIRNTVGNIPMKWYDEYNHLGYDWDGIKLRKPAKADELDKFLTKMEDPNYWRTVHDKLTGQDVILSNEDVEALQRVKRGAYPDPEYDPYEPFSDFFTFETRIHPVTNRPEHKRSFIPSLIEKEKVSKMVHAIKMGWLNPNKKDKKSSADVRKMFYMLWSQDQSEMSKRLQHYIPAPKLKLPGHEESYNPPPEYLFTPEEEAKWMSQEPQQRTLDFIPQKYSSLRAVPAYSKGVQERFERCLDLYLCPRLRKTRLNIEPEDLIPKLPKPKDLQPFPTTISLIYKGHDKMVRCISVEPLGQFFASGSDDNTIKIWEVQTGRCFNTIPVDGHVTSIAWCPNDNVSLLAVSVNNNVLIITPKVGDKVVIDNTIAMITSDVVEEPESSGSKSVTWRHAAEDERRNGFLLVLEHSKPVTQVVWHCRGDYFATVAPDDGNSAVLIHQLSKHRSQQPFNKSKGRIQKVLFHPVRPYFFVASQKHVRCYNLMKQELAKKLFSNCKWISSMAVHPGGDNVIIGSYDCRLGWFDLDLSNKPYQMLRHHKKAVRQVAFHRKYPLFASASDDASVIVCHGMVYNDLLQNPLIVPVKVLRGHESRNDVGVMDCQFHPTQPWLLTSGADGKIILYT